MLLPWRELLVSAFYFCHLSIDLGMWSPLDIYQVWMSLCYANVNHFFFFTSVSPTILSSDSWINFSHKNVDLRSEIHKAGHWDQIKKSSDFLVLRSWSIYYALYFSLIYAWSWGMTLFACFVRELSNLKRNGCYILFYWSLLNHGFLHFHFIIERIFLKSL